MARVYCGMSILLYGLIRECHMQRCSCLHSHVLRKGDSLRNELERQNNLQGCSLILRFVMLRLLTGMYRKGTRSV